MEQDKEIAVGQPMGEKLDPAPGLGLDHILSQHESWARFLKAQRREAQRKKGEIILGETPQDEIGLG